MDTKDLAVVNKSDLQSLIDDLKYLEGKMLPLLKSVVKQVESVTVELDEKLNKNISKELIQSLNETAMINKLLYYTVVTDKVALDDVREHAKKVKDKAFLKWLDNKEIKDLQNLLIGGKR